MCLVEDPLHTWQDVAGEFEVQRDQLRGRNNLLWRALRHVWSCPMEPFACEHPDHELAKALIANDPG